MGINAVVTRRADGGWHFTWDAEGSADLPYAIWLDGVLLKQTSDNLYDFTQGGYEEVPPDIEIVNGASGTVAENYLYPPYVLLQWRGLLLAAGYVVERHTGSSSDPWVTVGNILERGSGYYSWRSPALEDMEQVAYRVSALDFGGGVGAPITFHITVCRNPIHPDVDLDVSSAGDIVVSGV